MNLIEFSSLTQKQQLEFLSDRGERISKRLDEEHDVLLYQLEEFFVEVFFHRVQLQITHLLAFCHTQLPDAYFESEELTAHKLLALSKNLLQSFQKSYTSPAALKINIK